MLEFFYMISLIVQLFHSTEELSTGFHKKNFFFVMSFKEFLIFEVGFFAIFSFILLFWDSAMKDIIMQLFLLTMFANGVRHITRSRIERRYMPGLITGIIHAIVFIVYYLM